MKYMKRKCSRIITIFGAMLLCAALFLVLYNLYQDKKSGEISHGILSELKQVISEQTLPEDYESIYTMPSENLYDEYENSQEEVNIPTVLVFLSLVLSFRSCLNGTMKIYVLHHVYTEVRQAREI